MRCGGIAVAALAALPGCALFYPAERLLLDCQRDPIPLVVRRDAVDGPRRLFVAVTLDGQPTYFIVDTGATRTGIKHNVEYDYVVRGAARIRLGCGSARVDSTRGEIDLDPGGAEAAGLLGADGILDGPTLLDLRAGQIVRAPRGLDTSTWLRVPLEQSHDVPIVTVTVDGQRRRLALDTGAPDTLLFVKPPPTAKRHRTHRDVLKRSFTARSTFVTLAWTPSDRGRLVRADFTDESPPMRDLLERIDGRAEGLLGLSALDGARVLFDADHDELRIDLPPQAEPATPSTTPTALPASGASGSTPLSPTAPGVPE